MRRALRSAGLAVRALVGEGSGAAAAAGMHHPQVLRSGAGTGRVGTNNSAALPLLPAAALRRPQTSTPTLVLARASSSSSYSSRSKDDNQTLPPSSSSGPSSSSLRLSPPPPHPLTFRKWSAARAARRANPLAHHAGVRAARQTRGEVEVVLELPVASGSAGGGNLLGGGGGGTNASSPSSSIPREKAERLAKQLGDDAPLVIELAIKERAAMAARQGKRYVPPQVALASVVLCDDRRMRELNFEHRGKDTSTDVLTLELRDEAVDCGRVRLPVRLLGDAIISLDTAARQAAARRGLEERRRSKMMQGGAVAAVADVGGKRRRRATEDGGGATTNKGFGGGGGSGGSVSGSSAAAASKSENGYTLLDELRVLLVHGALHLVGMDHEASDSEHEAMAAAERRLMQELGWRGSGLISAAEQEAEEEDDEDEKAAAAKAAAAKPKKKTTPSSSSSSSSSSLPILFSTRPRLVALDMDGTLLNGSSRIDASSARVIRAAVQEKGVRVILATGKARPAALAAARAVDLDPILCSEVGPGVFLQGLAVHGSSGESLCDRALPPSLVRSALLWAEEQAVPLCCFLGDECATLRLTDELKELHERYYEPLSVEYGGGSAAGEGLDALLERAAAVGGTRKLLFMTSERRVRGLVEPYWRAELSSSSSSPSSPSPFAGLADVTVAVQGMLEVVPKGVNKMVGVRALLEHLQISPQEAMAVGDGSNDLEMVAGVGLGVAMGNAVEPVKRAAKCVVASNEQGGIVEAFERFVL